MQQKGSDNTSYLSVARFLTIIIILFLKINLINTFNMNIMCSFIAINMSSMSAHISVHSKQNGVPLSELIFANQFTCTKSNANNFTYKV